MYRLVLNKMRYFDSSKSGRELFSSEREVGEWMVCGCLLGLSIVIMRMWQGRIRIGMICYKYALPDGVIVIFLYLAKVFLS